MPANLSPEYKAAEAAYRKAREPRERLECLREMLRTIPKHKGTEHLQADIKARIKDLAEDLEGGRRGGGGHSGGPALVVRPEGAAQVALIGPPNAGKSSLHARLTGSAAHVAPYPYTTQFPEPGMLPHQDIHFQLVDLPPVAREHPVAWLGVVRIYTKAPGHAPDKGRPFTLRRGQTVDDLARLIHKDLVRSLKYARVWGHCEFDGQHVGHGHVLGDGDIVELHT